MKVGIAPSICTRHLIPGIEMTSGLQKADLIILGPGSLYTSVIPNLLIDEISKTISKAKAKKLYVCNIMTQPGETDKFTVSDHVRTIMEHAKYTQEAEAIMEKYVTEENDSVKGRK